MAEITVQKQAAFGAVQAYTYQAVDFNNGDFYRASGGEVILIKMGAAPGCTVVIEAEPSQDSGRAVDETVAPAANTFHVAGFLKPGNWSDNSGNVNISYTGTDATDVEIAVIKPRN